MSKPTDNGAEDPRWPPVRRRKDKTGNSECLCMTCGKWSGFGLISGMEPPYKYTCPECLP